MELRAGYKQTEVGVIPEEWEVLSVSDVTKSFQNGFAFASHGYSKSGIPIVTMAQIGLDGRFKFKEEIVNHWPSSEASKLATFQLFRGDIIIAMTDVTPEKNLIGRMTEVTEDGPLLLNQRVGLLRLDPEKIDPYFLRAVSNSKMWRDYARAVASLGVQANIGTKEIQAGKLPVPPLPEQRAIAGALSDVDTLIGALDSALAKRRDLKQAAMQQLLTGLKRLPGFHGEWEVKRLGDVVEIIKGELITEKDAIPGNIPVIAGGKKPAYFHNRANRAGKTITISGSGASAGYVSFFEMPIFASDCSTIREGPSYVIQFIYFVLHLRQGEIYRAQTGGAQPHIHPNDLRPMSIGVPQVAEQTAIAEVLSDMDAELAALEQRRDKTRALKQGMMQELLTGRTRLV